MKEVTNAIHALEGERDKLTLAIDALKHLNRFVNANVPAPAPAPARKGKRVFSLATRRKLAAAQRARWAKIKAARQPKLVRKAA